MTDSSTSDELSTGGLGPEPGGSDLDLTPRPAALATSGRTKVRNRLIVGGIALVLGFVLFQALTSASEFYYNVDEAVADRSDLGDDTFRMQGVVVSEPLKGDDGVITFRVSFGDVDAEIRHIGEEPTDLFELGIPVVMKGHWAGSVFESEQILIKHSETYIAENGDRDGVGEYNDTDAVNTDAVDTEPTGSESP